MVASAPIARTVAATALLAPAKRARRKILIVASFSLFLPGHPNRGSQTGFDQKNALRLLVSEPAAASSGSSQDPGRHAPQVLHDGCLQGIEQDAAELRRQPQKIGLVDQE